MARYGNRRLLTLQELRNTDGWIFKRDKLYIALADWERKNKIKKRRTQRSWKVQRKTHYHRIAGLTAKQVNKYINFCIKFNLESRFKRAGL